MALSTLNHTRNFWGYIYFQHYIWWLEGHISGCFSLSAPKFGKAVGAYEWYFVILWMHIEWWGHPEVVGTLKPCIL